MRWAALLLIAISPLVGCGGGQSHDYGDTIELSPIALCIDDQMSRGTSYGDAAALCNTFHQFD